MTHFSDLMQTADWKKEKHVPVIDAPEEVKKGEKFKISITIGKEIEHPNTTEHHIEWMSLFFKPANDKFAYEIGNYTLGGHGASGKGPNEGPVYSDPELDITVKLQESGTLFSSSYCNIHGLWEDKKEIKVN